MNNKTFLTVIKLIPVISAAVSFILIFGSYSAAWISKVSGVTVILAFLGFAFFFIGRRSAKDDRIIKILGILDIFSTVSIVMLYALAVFSFGL